MGPQGRLTAQGREQRLAKKRRRELERDAKQQAKLTELQKARCEVELYENQIELLLSVHMEQGPVWDWSSVAAALPPPTPRKLSYHEFTARQRACFSWVDQAEAEAGILQAKAADEELFGKELQSHAAETADIDRFKTLALRILAGEPKAYTDALAELSPFGELSSLGSNLHFTVHGPDLLECILKVNGTQAIPSEVKSLTATEKLSVKAMPRARFHELYQDHICSCILRVAREVFALLPVGTILITATADVPDPGGRGTGEKPVLSVAITRAALNGLAFEHLDPSDAVDGFLHRGDFKASRKSGAFAPIIPLTPADLPGNRPTLLDGSGLLLRTKNLREKLRAEISELGPIRATVK